MSLFMPGGEQNTPQIGSNLQSHLDLEVAEKQKKSLPPLFRGDLLRIATPGISILSPLSQNVSKCLLPVGDDVRTL